MSGIVGVVNPAGVPVDPLTVRALTEFLSFRGPDAREFRVAQNVGLGHTMLRVGWDDEGEQQPFTLDGNSWIVADARIDARAGLKDELQASGDSVGDSSTPELLLRAYHRWGTDCVRHLYGDFSFA